MRREEAEALRTDMQDMRRWGGFAVDVKAGATDEGKNVQLIVQVAIAPLKDGLHIKIYTLMTFCIRYPLVSPPPLRRLSSRKQTSRRLCLPRIHELGWTHKVLDCKVLNCCISRGPGISYSSPPFTGEDCNAAPFAIIIPDRHQVALPLSRVRV